ncbi:hypothetical protein CGLAU_04010 [Corynebacterium glaucum]|uniref:Uncharacterized protein n=2 Tax=Corynebacterium glaucum TaxID=187491 RepID=A0A1Q2HV99_9CORY|nr:hypothetical protein CGLAU_04010 [Corynebacterium glaucum]WJZ07285.1 hypothetical protein CGLAUT_03925 [Corynebacterium glaucum]
MPLQTMSFKTPSHRVSATLAGMTPLSSTLHHNFHSGAQDVRDFAASDLAAQWIPGSWRQSLTDLSYSVTGLWDSLVRALMLVL